MKEILERITKNLNSLGQGYFKYIEQEHEDYLMGNLSSHQTYIKYSIVREDPEHKVLFMNSYIFNKNIKDTEESRNKLRELLLSNILAHAVFGLRGILVL